MSVAGTYETVVKSPMGDQKGTFTVVPGDDGNTFTGSMAGGMGSMDVKDGTIDGNTLRLIVSCDESNVTSVKDTLAQLDAASLELKLPSGVTISRSDALTVGTALLTRSGVPVMLLS